MAKNDTGQSVSDNALHVFLGGDFDELGNFSNQVIDAHPGADRQIELRVAEVTVFGHHAGPDEAVAQGKRDASKILFNEEAHQLENFVVEESEAAAEVFVVIVGEVFRMALQGKSCEGSGETQHSDPGRFGMTVAHFPDVAKLREVGIDGVEEPEIGGFGRREIGDDFTPGAPGGRECAAFGG